MPKPRNIDDALGYLDESDPIDVYDAFERHYPLPSAGYRSHGKADGPPPEEGKEFYEKVYRPYRARPSLTASGFTSAYILIPVVVRIMQRLGNPGIGTGDLCDLLEKEPNVILGPRRKAGPRISAMLSGNTGKWFAAKPHPLSVKAKLWFLLDEHME